MLMDRRLVLAAGFTALAGNLAFATGPLTRLTIVTRAGARHDFQLELADTPEKRARGLMFRRSLPDGHGMLFEFGPRETEVTMWMKNTYIPLDMIFIRADGTIRHIAENTTPLSEAIVPSNGPVKGVLEVIAGTSRRLGLAPGDRVEHPWFGR
jgi:uncharacterized membrane protein (UPF0127 family)